MGTCVRSLAGVLGTSASGASGWFAGWLAGWFACLARWLACLLRAGCAGCLSGASVSGAFGVLAGWLVCWLSCLLLSDYMYSGRGVILGPSWTTQREKYCC